MRRARQAEVILLTPPQTSRKAILAFLLGMAALVFGFLAIAGQSDLLLLGVAGCSAFALGFGVAARRDVRTHSNAVCGARLAAWGMGLPIAGIGLRFLLLPAM